MVEPRTDHSEPGAAMTSHPCGLRAEQRWPGVGRPRRRRRRRRETVPSTKDHIVQHPRPYSPSTPPSCHLPLCVLRQHGHALSHCQSKALASGEQYLQIDSSAAWLPELSEPTKSAIRELQRARPLKSRNENRTGTMIESNGEVHHPTGIQGLYMQGG